VGGIGGGTDRSDLHEITLTWSDPDPDRPAVDVLVRLLALTDYAHDRGELEPFLMEPASDGVWRWTARLPSDLRTAYQFCPARHDPIPRRALTEDEWATLVAEGVPDPAIDDNLPPGCVFGNPGRDASVLSLPAALAQPWHARRPSVARGELERVELGDSVVHVYRTSHPTASEAEALPLAVLFDGGTLLDLDIAATFDNLIHEDVVRPFLAVIVESINGSARRGPTRVQSLTALAEFETFVVDELVPHLRARFAVTDDPARSVVIGQSLGGLAALWLTHGHAELFGHAVAQSASLWWPGGTGQLSGEDVLTAYADSPPAVGLFLEAGSEEAQVLDTNRSLRQVLEDGGRPFRYREYRGGHDYACWRGGIADCLVATLAAT
jgi:enterochelin esterase-like enzyme